MEKTLKQWTVSFRALMIALALISTAAMLLLSMQHAKPLPILLSILTVLLCIALLIVHAHMIRRLTMDMQSLQADAPRALTRDAATGVYDREACLFLMDRHICSAESDDVHGVLMLELTGMPPIQKNEMPAHEQAAAVARKMQSLFRKTDIVGRIAENTFVVFLQNIGTRTQLETQAATLLAELDALALANCPPLRHSIGGSLFPADAQDCAALLQKAESALTRARQWEQNSYALFHPQTDDVFS